MEEGPTRRGMSRSLTVSKLPPRARATMGVPHAWASTDVIPKSSSAAIRTPCAHHVLPHDREGLAAQECHVRPRQGPHPLLLRAVPDDDEATVRERLERLGEESDPLIGDQSGSTRYNVGSRSVPRSNAVTSTGGCTTSEGLP